jgi:outer membrane receptor protein involved in Fe transport
MLKMIKLVNIEMRIVNLILLAAALLLLNSSSLFASDGELVGKIIDKSTGNPLPFANVIIVGTKMGAAADENGKYHITHIPSGVYSVEARYVGYKTVKYENVNILVNRITTLDFKLPSQSVIGQEVVIQAKRPAVDLEVASSAKVITSDDVKNMPIVTNVKDLVALQSGVVKVGEDIHIRGGRSDEVLYLIDGVPAKNPVTGINSVNIDINQIEQVEIITGGFDAEYGNANSGIINIITKSGREKYTGDVIVKGDQLIKAPASTNYNYVYTGISGPFAPFKWLGISGNSGFTLSANMDLDDTFYEIGGGYGTTKFLFMDIPNRQVSNYSIAGQFNYQPIKSLRIKVNGQFDQGNFKNFNWAWSKIPQNLPISFHKTDKISALINQTFGKNSFYNLNFSYTLGRSKTSLLGLASPTDAFSYQFQYFDYDGNPIPDDQIDDILANNPSIVDFSKTVAKYERPPIARDNNYDGFIDEGEYSDYYENKYKSYFVGFDYTHFVGVHKLKGGINFSLDDIDNLEINDYGQFYPQRDTIPGPWPQYGASRWYFKDKVWSGSFYIQDRINYSGMFLNLGVRGDLYGHGSTINDPDFIRQFNNATGYHVIGFKKMKLLMSPRLGLSIPANKDTKLFFNYGYFIQKPSFGELYRDPFLSSVIGNPDLDPRKSINYEVGMETEFIKNYVLNIKLYGRDYAGDIGYKETDTNPRRVIYQNTGFGSARGFEIEFRKIYSDFFSFTANYTYLLARGFDLTALDNYNQGSTVPPAVREQRVNWDVNHNLKIMFNFEVMESRKLHIFGMDLSDIGLYFLMTSNFGRPYTPIIPHAIYVEPNSSTGPGQLFLDATFYKGIRVGATRFVLFAEAKNLLNVRNINMGSGFNRRTGNVVNLGDLAGDSNRLLTPYEVEFARANMAYSPERTIRMGLKIYIR